MKDPANPEHGLPESANKTLLIHTKKIAGPDGGDSRHRQQQHESLSATVGKIAVGTSLQ